MGISYVAKFAYSGSIDTLASALAEVCQLRIDLRHCGRCPRVPTVTLIAPAFEMDVTVASTMDRDFCKQEFDIRIDTCVRFLVWSEFATDSDGGVELAQIVNLLLEYTEGDFIFLFNEEQVLLLRVASKLTVNSEAGFWNRRNRAAIRLPFDEKPLESS